LYFSLWKSKYLFKALCNLYSRATNETNSISAPAKSIVAGAQNKFSISATGLTTSEKSIS
jgi:hypothetical protein